MADTGAIYGDRCYPTQSDALDMYYSQMAPAHTAGSPSYVNEFVKTGGVWVVNQFSISDSGAWTLRSSSAAPVIPFSPCDPAGSFLDGMTVGWGIAGAIITAYAFRLMQRAAA